MYTAASPSLCDLSQELSMSLLSSVKKKKKGASAGPADSGVL